MHKLKYIFIFCFFLVLASCSDMEDNQDPVIIYEYPEEAVAITMPDTLDVRVEISDDRMIRTVVLSLVDENKIPVVPSLYYYPNTAQYTLLASLPLVDKTLENGQYQLLVTASDGVNSKDKYREIRINGIPVEIKAYFAITKRLDFESNIHKLNPVFETDTQFTIYRDYRLSAVHSLWEQFYFVTGEPSDLVAYDPVSFETEWEMEAAPPRPLITAVIPDEQLVFSTANGDAGVLSSAGDVILRTAPLDGKTILHLAADDQYIYAAHMSLSGDIHQLTVYYRVSGAIRDQKTLAGVITGLVPVNGLLIVFISSPPGTVIMLYSPVDLTMEQLNFLENENLGSAIRIADNELFILTESRVIDYDLAGNRFTDFISQPYALGRYDPIKDIIYLARDSVVSGYARKTGDLLKIISFPDEVLDFQILYNK